MTLGWVWAAAIAAIAAPLAGGDACVLSDRIALKASAQGATLRVVEAGERVEIVSVAPGWSSVRVGGQDGAMRTPFLQRVCRVVSAPAQPAQGAAAAAGPAARPAEAPADPIAEVTVAAGEDVGGDATAAPQPTAPAAPFGDTYKIKVAVMTLSGSSNVESSLLGSLTSAVAETLDALGPFDAISTEDVKQMVQYEVQQQLLGCADDQCASRLGGALGADFVVSGSLTAAGSTSVLQLQLLNVTAASVDNRISREHVGDADGLFAAVRGATKQLVREILGARSGKLRVAVSEEGATIAVNGSIVGVSPLREPLTLAGGSHTLSVEKEGFVLFRQDYAVQEDRETPADARLQPSVEFIRAYQADAGRVRVLAWTGIATGSALVLTSVALFAATQASADALGRDIAAYNDEGLRRTERYDELRARQAELGAFDGAALGTLLTGSAAAGVGLLLYLLGDDPSRYDVFLGPEGVAIAGRF